MAAKRKARPARRDNPYRDMGDRELAEARERLLDDYAERLEYFAQLPEWQSAANCTAICGNPRAWGITRAEAADWAGVLREHHRAAPDVANATGEHRRRLTEAARERVSACETFEQAAELYGAYKTRRTAREMYKHEGETMREYVYRLESWYDENAERHGALLGELDVFSRCSGLPRGGRHG